MKVLTQYYFLYSLSVLLHTIWGSHWEKYILDFIFTKRAWRTSMGLPLHGLIISIHNASCQYNSARSPRPTGNLELHIPPSYNLGSYMMSLDLFPVMLALQCLCHSGQGQKITQGFWKYRWALWTKGYYNTNEILCEYERTKEGARKQLVGPVCTQKNGNWDALKRYEDSITAPQDNCMYSASLSSCSCGNLGRLYAYCFLPSRIY